MSGKFIVFEGVEGSGKTTQIKLCSQWLESLGFSVVVTRQPGGTELGLYLRQLLLESQDNIGAVTELLLYAADRSQHVITQLKPNLAQDKIILCDRYTDSTIAYQGYGRGLDLQLISQINAIATCGLESDLTLWLDLDVEIGLSRKRGDGQIDRIEQETIEFHRRVQQGYQELHADHPQKIIRIDASLTKEALQQQIQATLIERL